MVFSAVSGVMSAWSLEAVGGTVDSAKDSIVN